MFFGLAITFPLATSIQTAFKRRERAIEYLSLFNAGMLAIHYSIRSTKKLAPEKKLEAAAMLTNGTDRLLHHLQVSDGETLLNFKVETDAIMAFVEQNRDFISTRTLTRVIRYLKDVLDGATYLLSITRHRTMRGLRFFAVLFINVFVILQAPILVYNLGDVFPSWAIYFWSTLGSVILITLYNFQAQIEYPFDQKGADDIKLADYKLNI